MEPGFEAGDALLVVDVQRDFCTGGALAVPAGEAIVPLLNRWIEKAEAAGVPIFFSRDWHPAAHVSFRESGGPWPPHCLQDSPGAAFHSLLTLPKAMRRVTKGVRFDKDQNSAFDETGLAVELRRLGVARVVAGGLALDVCVRATVLDALRLGFSVRLIRDASRPVDPAQGGRTLEELGRAGATLETTG